MSNSSSSSSSGICNQITLSDIIELCRREHEWTQTDLARAARVPIAVVKAAETNAGNCDTMSLVAISEALGVDLFDAYRRAHEQNLTRDRIEHSNRAIITPIRSIPVNRATWKLTPDNYWMLTDVHTHHDEYAMIQSSAYDHFVGKKVTPALIDLGKTKARSDLTSSFFGNYLQLLDRTRHDSGSDRMTYETQLVASNPTRITREARAVKVSQNKIEVVCSITNTRANGAADVPCCRSASNCNDCYLTLARHAIRVASKNRKVS